MLETQAFKIRVRIRLTEQWELKLVCWFYCELMKIISEPDKINCKKLFLMLYALQGTFQLKAQFAPNLESVSVGKFLPPIIILGSSQFIPQELLVKYSSYFVTVLWFEIAIKNKKICTSPKMTHRTVEK